MTNEIKCDEQQLFTKILDVSECCDSILSGECNVHEYLKVFTIRQELHLILSEFEPVNPRDENTEYKLKEVW